MSLPSFVNIYSEGETEIRDIGICDSTSCLSSMTSRLFA